MTGLGVSPTLIRASRRMARSRSAPRPVVPALVRVHRFALEPRSWHWFFDVVGGSRRPIINYSGGTEISGGILVGNLLTPSSPPRSPARPGMAADVVDAEGGRRRGEVGELADPPAVDRDDARLLDDPRQRYLEAYWSRFPGVWVHGDWAISTRTATGTSWAGQTTRSRWRASASARQKSKRSCGPPGRHAGRGDRGAGRGQGRGIVCFCCLAPGRHCRRRHPAGRAAGALVEELGKPLKPREIRFAAALPRTRNAKVMHRMIRAAYLGRTRVM